MKLSLRNLISIELVSSVVILLALSRPWIVASYSETGFPTVNLSLSANQLSPSLNGLTLAAIASALGVIATRGFFRRIVGAVILALGVGIVLCTLSLLNNLDTLVGGQFEQAIGRQVSGWSADTSSYAALVIPAAVVMALCGLAITIKTFETGMSKRYERNPVHESQLTPWQALDQGIDPTIQSNSEQ
jgi:uncharacterized membrane protein (TIGR02234 family)